MWGGAENTCFKGAAKLKALADGTALLERQSLVSDYIYNLWVFNW